jgi:hypothetical protein
MSKREIRHLFELIRMLGEWFDDMQERQKAAAASMSSLSAEYDRNLPLRRG